MYFEIWLLGTALIFTFVGYFMGQRKGLKQGIDGTLQMLAAQEYIKVSTRQDGEIVIEKAE